MGSGVSLIGGGWALVSPVVVGVVPVVEYWNSFE